MGAISKVFKNITHAVDSAAHKLKHGLSEIGKGVGDMLVGAVTLDSKKFTAGLSRELNGVAEAGRAVASLQPLELMATAVLGDVVTRTLDKFSAKVMGTVTGSIEMLGEGAAEFRHGVMHGNFREALGGLVKEGAAAVTLAETLTPKGMATLAATSAVSVGMEATGLDKNLENVVGERGMKVLEVAASATLRTAL